MSFNSTDPIFGHRTGTGGGGGLVSKALAAPPADVYEELLATVGRLGLVGAAASLNR